MIRVEATLYDGNSRADCLCSISGNGEAIAVEYATLTKALMKADGGQTILDRAREIMKKEINVDEEKRSE